jgi:aryl-alcohol dehydrogenase-like predicted oxidoreductase
MGFSQGYGHADDRESIHVIQGCVDAGVTLLDTAQSYGRGHNERLVGSVLAKMGPARQHIQLATKFGITRGEDGVYLDAKPEHVKTYCNASLERLGVDVIDLYYLHRVDPEVDLKETIGAMAELVDAGKVRFLGLSEVTPEQLEIAHSVHPISAVQFEWSLLWREPEISIIPTARKLGVGIVPYSPIGRGFLSAGLETDEEVHSSQFRRSDPRFNGEALERNRKQLHALSQFAQSHGMTAAQLSLAWLLAQGEDVVPIPGTRRLDRALENIAAAEFHLSESDLHDLDNTVPPKEWVGDRQSFAVPTTQRPKLSGVSQ